MTDKSLADRIKDAQAYLWAVGVIALAATTYTGTSRDILNLRLLLERTKPRN